jgi:hypothetical protein
MNHNLLTVFIVVVAIALCFVMLWLSNSARKKMGLEPPASKISTKFLLLLIVIIGILAGSFFSSRLDEEIMSIRLLYSVIVFFIIGVPEVLLIRRVHNRLSSIYLLDGEIFPFFSLGVSVAVLLMA